MAFTIEQLQKIHDALAQQNEDLIKTNDFGKERKTTTTKIIRSIAALLFVLLIFNLFIMFQLNTHLMNIVQQIDTMKSSFKQVSHTMEDINNDVKDISIIMTSMPNIALSMQQIESDMPMISNSMNQITTDIELVDHHLLQLNHKMQSVGQKMGGINNSTLRIQHNMKNIAQPTRFFNWMLPN